MGATKEGSTATIAAIPWSRVVVTILCAVKHRADDDLSFEIGQRPVVEDKLHCTRYEPSRAIRSRGSLWDTSLRAGSLLRSRIGQPQVTHMVDIVEQRARRGILLRLGQAFDLAQRLFEQFCHG
jgi:hypothetical protein